MQVFQNHKHIICPGY